MCAKAQRKETCIQMHSRETEYKRQSERKTKERQGKNDGERFRDAAEYNSTRRQLRDSLLLFCCCPNDANRSPRSIFQENYWGKGAKKNNNKKSQTTSKHRKSFPSWKVLWETFTSPLMKAISQMQLWNTLHLIGYLLDGAMFYSLREAFIGAFFSLN